MKHSLLAAARAAPLHGLLATAALHAMAAQKLDVTPTPALAPAAATDLDTGQPQAIAFDAKAHSSGKKHLRRDSAGPPIGMTYGQRMVDGVHKAQGGGYHRRREVALN